MISEAKGFLYLQQGSGCYVSPSDTVDQDGGFCFDVERQLDISRHWSPKGDGAPKFDTVPTGGCRKSCHTALTMTKDHNVSRLKATFGHETILNYVFQYDSACIYESFVHHGICIRPMISTIPWLDRLHAAQQDECALRLFTLQRVDKFFKRCLVAGYVVHQDNATLYGLVRANDLHRERTREIGLQRYA